MMPGRLEASTCTRTRICLLHHCSSIPVFTHLRSRLIHFTHLTRSRFPFSLFTTCFHSLGSIENLPIDAHHLAILPSYSEDLDPDHQILRHPSPFALQPTTTSSA
jgi:hypothetical protein